MSDERSAASPGLNLLRVPGIRALLLWRGFPEVFQAIMLAAFVALAVVGWGRLAPEGANPKLYAKANLVNLAIWGLWWPAIVWITVLAGRAWCMACPLQLVSDTAERLGRRLGIPQGRIGGWVAGGWFALLLFVILQMLVPGVQIHRVPWYTSIFLVVMLTGAFAAGLLLRDRAFCRGVCPVALLLNAYGRGGMLAVRAGAPDALPAGAYRCPTLLNPPRVNSNKDCLLCARCVQLRAPQEMRYVLRAPFSGADAREPLASWPVTLFVMVVSGFVTYELCGVWKAADPVFLWVPRKAAEALHAGPAAGWIQGVWTVGVVPLILWLALGAAARLLGGAASLGEAWRRLALPAAVIVAAGHMAKGLEKFTSWAGFLPHAWAEPGGARTALRMAAKAMPQPAAWLSPPALSAVAMLVVAAAVGLALRESRLADPGRRRARAVPLLLLGGFYFFLVFGWGK